MRKRDFNKVMNEYKELASKNKCDFYLFEMRSIFQYAQKQSGGDYRNCFDRFSYNLLVTALEYGIVIGYRSGKNAAKRKRKKVKNNETEKP